MITAGKELSNRIKRRPHRKSNTKKNKLYFEFSIEEITQAWNSAVISINKGNNTASNNELYID